MTVQRDVQFKYFLAGFCLLLFLLWDRIKPGEIHVIHVHSHIHTVYTVYTKKVWKGTGTQEHRQVHIYLTFPCTPIIHSSNSSVCLAPPLLRWSSRVTLQSSRGMPVRSSSTTVQPPPIRLSYHNSEQSIQRYWFVDCTRCWSMRMSQNYKARGLLIHDLLRKISWESRLYLHHTAARVMRAEL